MKKAPAKKTRKQTNEEFLASRRAKRPPLLDPSVLLKREVERLEKLVAARDAEVREKAVLAGEYKREAQEAKRELSVAHERLKIIRSTHQVQVLPCDMKRPGAAQTAPARYRPVGGGQHMSKHTRHEAAVPSATARFETRKPRVRVWYEVTFRLEVEQDETGDDKVFDVTNGIRVDLECLKGERRSSDGHVEYLNVEEVGALTMEEIEAQLERSNR